MKRCRLKPAVLKTTEPNDAVISQLISSSYTLIKRLHLGWGQMTLSFLYCWDFVNAVLIFLFHPPKTMGLT